MTTSTTIPRGLLFMILGASLVALGDAFYGFTFYQGRFVSPIWHMASAVMGAVGGVLYILSAHAHSALVQPEFARLRMVLKAMFGLFGITVAVVHAYAGGLMLVMNYQLGPGTDIDLSDLQALLDQLYGYLILPLFLCLAGSYGLLAIAIAAERTMLPRSFALISPLVLMIPQQAAADMIHFSLRSPALLAVIFSPLVILYLQRAKQA